MSSQCCLWSEGDPILEEYNDHEWCKINHDDDFQFEMLCLEGDDLGLMLGGAYQDYTAQGNNGEAESTTDTFEKVLGHPLTPLAEALKELI